MTARTKAFVQEKNIIITSPLQQATMMNGVLVVQVRTETACVAKAAAGMQLQHHSLVRHAWGDRIY